MKNARYKKFTFCNCEMRNGCSVTLPAFGKLDEGGFLYNGGLKLRAGVTPAAAAGSAAFFIFINVYNACNGGSFFL